MSPSLEERMLSDLGRLVSCESPPHDVQGSWNVVSVANEIGTSWLGTSGSIVECDGQPHLRWTFGTPRLMLLGHLDTVWPAGTVQRWPFSVADGRMTGPGVFDMKSGVIQMFAALSQCACLDGVTILLNTDEELGSPTSRTLIESTAQGLTATLVLEPSAGGALKLARKGVSLYNFRITGRAAHAGLEPEAGINAVTELAHWVIAATALQRFDEGTTVTPTTANGGTAINVVPSSALFGLDVRATSAEEQRRVDDALRQRETTVPGASVDIEGGINRPPMEMSQSLRLFALAKDVAAERGLPEPRGVSVGGGSDGNFTAGMGVETLDGLGAVGDNAHAEGEWASVAALTERAALVSGIVDRILAS